MQEKVKLTTEQIKKFSKCLKRELSFRKRVYPRLVCAKKITQEKMDEEINTMNEMIEYFDKLYIQTEPEQTRLF